MSNQTILVADEKGNHTGSYVEKELAHSGKGKRHLAISVLLYNDKGQVLLQHRKHKIHNDIWDLTGSTHHLHRADGTDETSEEAALRCLRVEYAITEQIPLKVVGAVDYFAPYGDYCENEHDIILTGIYNGELKANKDVSYNHKWVNEKDFFVDISKNPKKYAPWAVKAAKVLQNQNKNYFLEDIEDFQNVFSRYSKEFFMQKIRLAKKYPKLISSFWENVEDFSTGGKSMRPYLVSLGYKINGGKDLSKILPIAMAIELVHSFLLIHDDVIDKSDVRRGKETIHKRYEKDFGLHYGQSQAIIVGDIVFFEAINLINDANLEQDLKKKVITLLTEFLVETGYGEALDVLYSHTKPSVKDVWEVTELKTARYSFVGPMQIGAIVGGAGNKLLNELEKFSTHVGIAFQLKDDLLGVFGKEEVIGKSILSDMVEGKNTILYLETKSRAKKGEIKKLEKIWGNSKAGKKELKSVQVLTRKTGAYDWCLKEMVRLTSDAKKIVPRISKNLKIQAILGSSADFVIERGR